MNKIKMMLYLMLGALLLAGCGNMEEQPKLEVYGESPLFGVAARDILPETVPVGQLREDTAFYEGREGDAYTTTLPVELNEDLLVRGRTQYESFCAPCHGYAGYGDGVIAREGFQRPASFHIDRLRDVPVGYIYEVITEGVGNMYNYAARIKPADRWAIVAYLRALQVSQNVPAAELSAEARAQLDAQPGSQD